MIMSWQDLLAIYCIMLSWSILISFTFTMLLYMYIQDRFDRVDKRVRRTMLMGRARKTEVFNPPAEDVAPPPMAEPVEQPQVTPYSVYLQSHAELWKLRVKGEDATDYADYLRGVMEECWSQLDATQRENAERDSAESWRHV